MILRILPLLGFALCCPDQDLGNECAVDCNNSYLKCLSSCKGDETCEEKCNRDFPDCVSSCPCYEGCPQGCQNCPHPICGGTGGCIDQDLGDRCIITCQETMIECISDCEGDSSCIALCNRNLPDCIISCPCSDGCPFGCYKCPNPICHEGETTILITTTEEPTEPPTTIPPVQYAALVLNSFGDNEPLMLNSTGRPIPGSRVTLDEYAEAYGSCLTAYRGTIYLFGGVKQKRQISRLNGCEFDRIGSTQFDFTYGSCGLFIDGITDFILLCFDHNHPYSCWVMQQADHGLQAHQVEYDTDNPHDYARLASFGSLPFTVGSKYASHSRTELLESKMSRWTQLQPYPFHDMIHSYATVSLDNEVYLFGGMTGAFDEVGTMAKFTRNKEWKLAGRLVEPRKGHSGILLPSNKLLVVGGEGLRHNEIHYLNDESQDPEMVVLNPLEDYKFYPELMLVQEDFCL